jgi:hypothetical protein
MKRSVNDRLTSQAGETIHPRFETNSRINRQSPSCIRHSAFGLPPSAGPFQPIRPGAHDIKIQSETHQDKPKTDFARQKDTVKQSKTKRNTLKQSESGKGAPVLGHAPPKCGANIPAAAGSSFSGGRSAGSGGFPAANSKCVSPDSFLSLNRTEI